MNSSFTVKLIIHYTMHLSLKPFTGMRFSFKYLFIRSNLIFSLEWSLETDMTVQNGTQETLKMSTREEPYSREEDNSGRDVAWSSTASLHGFILRWPRASMVRSTAALGLKQFTGAFISYREFLRNLSV